MRFESHITRFQRSFTKTCNAIWDCLYEDQLIKPNEETWRKIAEGFEERWQLPHCVGAMDGKHVVIQALPNSGSTFYNYKGSHCIVSTIMLSLSLIVLLALCDAQYRFTLVDIGGEGRHSDGGLFKNSLIGRLINSNNMKFPSPSPIAGLNEAPINYFIAADEAFPLSTCIMRPYPGHFLTVAKRIFNYRLCRARKVIENVFGILASRWRIYRKPIAANDCTITAIVKATVCLHNYILNSEAKPETITIMNRENETGEVMPGNWRDEENSNNLLPIKKNSSNMYGRSAEKVRKELSCYFMNRGAVSFQFNR